MDKLWADRVFRVVCAIVLVGFAASIVGLALDDIRIGALGAVILGASAVYSWFWMP